MRKTPAKNPALKVKSNAAHGAAESAKVGGDHKSASSAGAPRTPGRGRPRGSRTTKRVSRSEWVAAGLKALAQGGIGNVRVEVLAAQLGVSKGGFYWHFKDREALLVEMLAAWRWRHTQQVAHLVKRATDDPRKRLEMLFDVSMADREEVPGGRLEQAIREWAAISNFPRDAVRQVDAERLRILQDLYQDLGLQRAEAEAYAFLSYSYNIGSNTVYSTLGRAALQAQRALCIDLLFTPDKSALSRAQTSAKARRSSKKD